LIIKFSFKSKENYKKKREKLISYLGIKIIGKFSKNNNKEKNDLVIVIMKIFNSIIKE
jgi:hypothetical protein